MGRWARRWCDLLQDGIRLGGGAQRQEPIRCEKHLASFPAWLERVEKIYVSAKVCKKATENPKVS